jgi:glycosyltransferase involved in cell wall biosynthesis
MLQRYEKMDKIICVSKEVEKEFNSFFKQNSKTVVIYNPMNSEDIIRKSNSSKFMLDAKDVFHFTAIGSLIPVKGFELLIDAARLLKEDGLNFKLNIIGSGQLKEKLSDLILDYDLQNFVKLWGFQSNPYGILKESDALVISSKTEGLPTVLCEAMILGKACIVPDITGCREVSNNGEFALQVERTPQGFFEGMKSIIEDAELLKTYENKAKQRSNIFDDKLAMNSYMQLFNKEQ